MKRKDFFKVTFFGIAACFLPKVGAEKTKEVKKVDWRPFALITPMVDDIITHSGDQIVHIDKDGLIRPMTIEDIRELKHDAVKRQDFEKASQYREMEKELLGFKHGQFFYQKITLKVPRGKYINIRAIRDLRNYTELYNDNLKS